MEGGIKPHDGLGPFQMIKDNFLSMNFMGPILEHYNLLLYGLKGVALLRSGRPADGPHARHREKAVTV